MFFFNFMSDWLHPNAPVSLFAMSVYPDNEMSQQPTYAFFASRFIPKCVCDFWFSFLAYGRRAGKVGNR